MEENTPESVDQELASIEAPESGAEKNLEYEKGVSLSDKIDRSPEALSNSQIADIEKLDKIRYNGKVYSGADFAKLFTKRSEHGMRLQNYNEKLGEIAKEREFMNALKADLPQLRKHPELIDEFKRVYPAKYHDWLDVVEAKAIAQRQAVEPESQDKPVIEQQQNNWKQDPELKEMFETFQEQRVETARVQVNSIFDKLATKYPDADDSWVAAKVQAERAQQLQENPGQKLAGLDEKVVEKYFKEAQASFEKKAEAFAARRFNAQKAASEKSKGPGAGGGIPGGAPKVARTIKEATELALADPGFN